MNLKQLLSIAVLSGAALGQASAANIVVNGSFENGTTGFTSSYTLGNGGGTSLYPEATYQIGSNPKSYHPGFATIAAQDGSNMMVVNGARQSDVIVWSESALAIQANTTYYFSTWVASVTSAAPAYLAFSINGVTIGNLLASGGTNWEQFYTSWNSGSATAANIALVNLNTSANGNDFALDNIAFDTLAPSTAVPEPTSIALLGLGLASALVARRRKKQS